MVYGQSLLPCINGNPDIFIFQMSRHSELFPEDVQYSIASDKPYKVNISGRDTKPRRHFKVFGKILDTTDHLLDRSFTLQGAVPVVVVMEYFKSPCLGYNMIKTLKVLGPEKHLVKYILEFLYDAVSPGLPNGDKYWLYAKIKADPDDKAE